MNPTIRNTNRITVASAAKVNRLRIGRRNRFRTPYSHGKSITKKLSASTRTKALREQLPNCGDKKSAEVVGEAVAKQAMGVGIKCVCFDKNRYKFHGRVKALAEAARKTGLVF